MRLERYILLGIIILSLVVRLSDLTAEGIWLDEAVSAYNAMQPVEHILSFVDTNPPLHLLVLHGFTYFGSNGFWLRISSVLFGVLSVFLIYLVGKELFNPRVGLYASFILSLSSYHIFYSQEARPYALLAFLTLSSFYFFLTYLKVPRKRLSLGYLVSTIFLLYTHYFGLFVVLVQNLHVLRWGKARNWPFLQAILVLSFIPGIFLILRALEAFSIFWLSPEFLIDILFLPNIFSGDKILTALFLLFSVAGIFLLWKGSRKRDISLLLMWMLVPILVPLTFSLYKVVILPKYVIFTSFPFFLLVAYSLDKLGRNPRVLLIGVIAVLSLTSIGLQAQTQDKENWGTVLARVEDLPQQYTNIILEPGYNIHPYAYYGLPECFPAEDIYTCAAGKKVFTAWDDLEDTSFTDNTPHIIYIARYPGSRQESPFLGHLKINYQLETSWTQSLPVRGSIEVSSWRREI